MGFQNKFDPARISVQPSNAVPFRANPPQTASPHVSRRRRFLGPQYLPEIPWPLFCQMVKLPGKSGWVGLAILRQTIMRKQTTVMLNCRQLADDIGVNPKAVYNALTVLTVGGIVTAQRGRGSFAKVTMLVTLKD